MDDFCAVAIVISEICHPMKHLGELWPVNLQPEQAEQWLLIKYTLFKYYIGKQKKNAAC